VAIGVLGGVYFILGVVWTRRLARWVPGPQAFGCAVAGMSWLRANVPGIEYPHGQPVHPWYRWPGLLAAPIGVGGEAFGNLLAGGAAGALVDLWRRWRVGSPDARPAASWLLATAGFALVGWPHEVPSAPPLDVAVVEPGFAPGFQNDPGYPEAFRRHVAEPVRATAGAGRPDAPDLLLLPESTFPAELLAEPAPARLEPPVSLDLHPRVHLLGGTVGRYARGEMRVVAVLVDHRGRLVTWWEKLAVVPAGETLPLDRWLPQWLRELLIRNMYRGLGHVPIISPGGLRPPALVGGHPIAAMSCYDNAFPFVARGLVQQGARVLCVLSNESWYRRGGELEQMVAMTVLRALETRTPLVRATVDGISVLVDASGRLVPGRDGAGARVPPRAAGDASPRVVRFLVPPAAAPIGSVARLHPVVAGTILATGLLVAAHALYAWARLLAVRSGKDRSASSS
jgi:apolipoprotein N-acyltransferase